MHISHINFNFLGNEFPQNGQNEVVWYPTPPLNTSFKSHRKLGGGARHSLKYLKFREAQKAANSS
jgi:hypothetical protein